MRGPVVLFLDLKCKLKYLGGVILFLDLKCKISQKFSVLNVKAHVRTRNLNASERQ